MRPGELAGLMRGLVESTPDAVIVVDEGHRIVLVNGAAEHTFGYPQEELIGSPVELLVPDDARVRHLAHHSEFMRHPRQRAMGDRTTTLNARHHDGRVFPVEISLRPVETDEGLLVAATVRDVSALHRALERSAWLTSLVESSGDAIIGLDPDGTIASWNPAAERLYGYTAIEALGSSDDILVPPGRRGEQERLRARALAGETVEQQAGEGLRKDTSTVPVAMTASPIRSGDGRPIGMALVVRDVTDQVRLEVELQTLADHDPLTGLFNRRRFTDELARHIAHVERYADVGGALLICDLDNLKHVNDVAGHEAGDELVKAVARVLRTRLRETDVAGRLGGDEFAVLLPRAGVDEAAAVAEALGTAARALELVIDGHPLHTTLSIGVARITANLTATQALAAGDGAMYQAKRRGRDRVVTATDEPPDPSVRPPPQAWAARLRSALKEGRFELFAQPIVALSGEPTERQEVLVRMRDDGDLVPPAAFLSTAERFGLIGEIDLLVLDRTIALLAVEPDLARAFHVNVSRAAITGGALLEHIAGSLASSSTDPGRLTLEVTEADATLDMDATRRFAHGLREIGCALALDDFGSGFGSFTCLKYVPVQFLNLDGGFASDLANHTNNQLLVKAIIDVAHGMRLKVIAKNVRSDRTQRLLSDFGADYGQGHHLGEPRPLPVAG